MQVIFRIIKKNPRKASPRFNRLHRVQGFMSTYVTQILTLYLSEFLVCEIEQIQEFHSVALFFHGIKIKFNHTSSH